MSSAEDVAAATVERRKQVAPASARSSAQQLASLRARARKRNAGKPQFRPDDLDAETAAMLDAAYRSQLRRPTDT